MYAIAFCKVCRGMKVGWNRKYLLHCIVCNGWAQQSVKAAFVTVALASLICAFPIPTEVVLSNLDAAPQGGQVAEASFAPLIDPAVSAIERLISPDAPDAQERSRIAQAVVHSGRKYNVDPKLVASIIMVESKAKAFAVSSSNSIGIMQIHLATWGATVDRENVNLFKIEDNIDFGVRILKSYISQYGLWPGVMRYKGLSASPDSQEDATAYVAKVRKIYDPSPLPSPSAPAADR